MYAYIRTSLLVHEHMEAGISPDNVESSLMDLQMAVSQANETEDQSSINLATIANIFRAVGAKNTSIPVSRGVVQSATNIVADIQSWNTDNATLAVLQNQSAE